jgi:hypothetical protein
VRESGKSGKQAHDPPILELELFEPQVSLLFFREAEGGLKSSAADTSLYSSTRNHIPQPVRLGPSRSHDHGLSRRPVVVQDNQQSVTPPSRAPTSVNEEQEPLPEDWTQP